MSRLIAVEIPSMNTGEDINSLGLHAQAIFEFEDVEPELSIFGQGCRTGRCACDINGNGGVCHYDLLLDVVHMHVNRKTLYLS